MKVYLISSENITDPKAMEILESLKNGSDRAVLFYREDDTLTFSVLKDLLPLGGKQSALSRLMTETPSSLSLAPSCP